jgi:CTP synthase (UTP-ammonia lyase)
MGIADADTAEHGDPAAKHLIVPVSCALPGVATGDPKLSGFEELRLVKGTRLESILGKTEIRERHFCNYEVNDGFRKSFEAAGLVVSAIGAKGETRAVELPGHPFFIATLFQPQLTSKAEGRVHPLIAELLNVAKRESANGYVASIPC